MSLDPNQTIDERIEEINKRIEMFEIIIKGYKLERDRLKKENKYGNSK